MDVKQLKHYNENMLNRKDMYCSKCSITFKKTTSTTCGICGHTLISTINIPKCPTCQSTKIKKISTATKAVHGFAFGLFSKTVHCQFECLNCHYKW